jgi:hypothetical protein
MPQHSSVPFGRKSGELLITIKQGVCKFGLFWTEWSYFAREEARDGVADYPKAFGFSQFGEVCEFG